MLPFVMDLCIWLLSIIFIYLGVGNQPEKCKVVHGGLDLVEDVTKGEEQYQPISEANGTL